MLSYESTKRSVRLFDKRSIISKKYCLCQEKFNASQGDVKVNSKPVAAEGFSKTKKFHDFY
jgi:hypothetical protein